MRNRWISDRIANAILAGRAPESRPDLTPLAHSIAEFRAAAYETTARPSEELMARLALTEAPAASSHRDSLPTIGAKKWGRTMFTWIAGLGIAGKIALGAGVAVAASAGAGAAGVLPPGAQDTFNTVVSTVVSDTEVTDDLTDDTTVTSDPESTGEADTTDETDATDEAEDSAAKGHPDNFGGWVSERAKDPNKVGSTFGAETSEAAKQNGKSPQVDTEAPAVEQDSSEGAGDGTSSHGKPEKAPSGKSGR